MSNSKIESIYSNVTLVINTLKSRRIKFNVVDECEQIRILLNNEYDEYYDNFTVADVIHVPIAPHSENFALVDHYDAWYDWIDFNEKQMALEAKQPRTQKPSHKPQKQTSK